jgi:hypothetical protein
VHFRSVLNGASVDSSPLYYGAPTAAAITQPRLNLSADEIATFRGITLCEEAVLSHRHRQFNEGRACDAVIRYLERRHGAVRSHVLFPEQKRHAAPIEVAFKLSATLYAMEHTGIEPFDGHTKLQATADVSIRPICAAVEGQLSPTEDFELHVPAGAFAGLGRKRLQDVQRILANWVVSSWPQLAIAPMGRYDTSVKPTSIPGTPFEVKLHRLEGLVKPGTLQIVHIVSDVEGLWEA